MNNTSGDMFFSKKRFIDFSACMALLVLIEVFVDGRIKRKIHFHFPREE